MQILDRILSIQIFYRASENSSAIWKNLFGFLFNASWFIQFLNFALNSNQTKLEVQVEKGFRCSVCCSPVFPPFFHRTVPDRQFFWQLLIQGWLFCSKNKIDGGYLRALNPEDVERHTRRGVKRSISVDLMIIQVFLQFRIPSLPSTCIRWFRDRKRRRNRIFFALN